MVRLKNCELAGFLLLRGRWEEWRSWCPTRLWITAAVAAPWYVLCAVINGWQFLQVFFINQNMERFTSTIHGHGRPFYFFLPVLLLLTFPWTFLLISALRRTFGRNDLFLRSSSDKRRWRVCKFSSGERYDYRRSPRCAERTDRHSGWFLLPSAWRASTRLNSIRLNSSVFSSVNTVSAPATPNTISWP